MSERLRFFTNLSESASRSSYYSPINRSPSQSCTSTERNSSNYFTYSGTSSLGGGTPRSRTASVSSSCISARSSSITPTPMEAIPNINIINATADNVDNEDKKDDTVESYAFIKLGKSATVGAIPCNTNNVALTPTMQRIRLKTIGKLALPQTFLNYDKNNNNNTTNNSSMNKSDFNSSMETSNAFDKTGAVDDYHRSTPKKVIGKIKSPFIENCQQLQSKQSLNAKCIKLDYRSSPYNALSSLENNEKDSELSQRKLNGNSSHKQIANSTSLNQNESNAEACKENIYNEETNIEEQRTPAVVEMRKKFTRIFHSSTGINLTPTTTPREGSSIKRNFHNVQSSSSDIKPRSKRSALVDDKYAKYFGLNCGTSTGSSESSSKDLSISCIKFEQTTPRSSLQMPSKENIRRKRSSNIDEKYLKYFGLENEKNKKNEQTTIDFGELSVDCVSSSTTVEVTNNNISVDEHIKVIREQTAANGGNKLLSLTPHILGNEHDEHMRDISAKCSTPIISAYNPNVKVETSQNISISPNAVSKKRNRAMTTEVYASKEHNRSKQQRPLTLTQGVKLSDHQVQLVKKFEDIVMSKEEFQLALSEFERIFKNVA